MSAPQKTYGRTIQSYYAKARGPVPLKADCPACAILLRGRKNSAQRDHELQAAVSIAPKPKGFGGRTV